MIFSSIAQTYPTEGGKTNSNSDFKQKTIASFTYNLPSFKHAKLEKFRGIRELFIRDKNNPTSRKQLSTACWMNAC